MKLSLWAWMAASTLVWGLACTVDMALTVVTSEAVEACVLLGLLCVVIGPLGGLLAWLTVSALARQHVVTRLLVTTLAVGTFALWLLHQTGAFARLSGAYGALAWATLLADVLASGIAIGLILAVVPSHAQPRGALGSLHPWTSIPLLLTTAALFEADRRYLVGLYPYLHQTLRVATWALATLTVAMRMPTVIVPRRFVAIGLTPLLALALAALFTQHRPRTAYFLELAPWPLLTLSMARALTDIDFDGYSGVLGGGDCAPLSPQINPGAREIADNGVDDNCLLGDSTTKDIQQPLRDDSHSPPTVDVVLITIDSLRPDRMGTFNAAFGPGGNATTPNLDRFAAHDTLVFENAFTAGGWTSIALPSLMRGVYPRRLSWTRYFETSHFRLLRRTALGNLEDGEQVIKMFPLPAGQTPPSVAVRLKARGMRTMAVVDDGFSEQLGRASGMATGFDEYREVDDLAPATRNDAGTTDLTIRMLDRVTDNTRFFLWVHYFGLHSPDERHEGVRLDGASLAQLYDHELRFVDQQVARLLTALDHRTRPPVVIVAADHGEDFIAEGRHHGFSLSEAVVRVPILLRIPGTSGRRVTEPVSLVDIAPTILTLTGSGLAPELDGSPLLTFVDGPRRTRRHLLADTWQYNRDGQPIRGQSAAMDGAHKVIFDRTLASWTVEQQSSDANAQRVTPDTNHTLVRALMTYLESTGGDLRLAD